jgi:hypothetical protein
VVLDFFDCPDRRVARCAAELASDEAGQPGTHVTVVLPRRSYAPLLGRLLHDRTADRIAGVVSRIPNVTATIVPFDVRSRIEVLHERQLAQAEKAATLDGVTVGNGAGGPPAGAAEPAPPGPPTPAIPPGPEIPAGPEVPVAAAAGDGPGPATGPAEELPPVIAAPHPSRLRGLLRHRRTAPTAAVSPSQPARATQAGDNTDYSRPTPPAGVNPIGSLKGPGRATVEGRVRAVEIRPVERNSVLAAEIADSTGDLTALFYGRSHIPGIICGARVRFRGPVGIRDGGPVMINPAYELLFPGMPERGDSPGGDGDDRPGT